MNQVAAASQRRPPEGGHYKFNSEFNCEERANAMIEAGEASLAPLVLSPDMSFDESGGNSPHSKMGSTGIEWRLLAATVGRLLG